MERVGSVKEIEEYLSWEGAASLVVDIEANEVTWTPNGNVISNEYYEVVASRPINEKCDCGEYYNDECELCCSTLEYLLDRVNEIKAANEDIISLEDFLKMAEDFIEAKIELEMDDLGQYANAAAILNKRAEYNQFLTDVYDNAEKIKRHEAQKIIDEALSYDEYKNE